MKYFYTALFVLAMFMGCSSSIEEGGPNGGGNKDGNPTGGAVGIGNGSGGNVDAYLAVTNYLAKDLLNPQVQEMQTATQALQQSISQACTVEPQSVTDLQDQWKEAMTAFHFTELFLYGPILLDTEALGDTNLAKDMIYSILDPSLQGPAIDREISKAAQRPDDYRPRKKQSIIGYDSLEYVLFAKLDGVENLTPDSVECVYLDFVSADLVERVDQVSSDWKIMLMDQLDTPNGQTKGRFYLDRLTKGMITFTDKGLKSRKMAVPLGIPVDNNDPFPCQQGVDCHTRYSEHPYSKMGRESIVTNLTAWELAFSGKAKGDGFGYNRFLENGGGSLPLSAAALDNGQLSAYWMSLPVADDYYAKIATFDGSDQSDNEVFRGFKLVQGVTSWLKSDFLVDMNLDLPGSVQGDND